MRRGRIGAGLFGVLLLLVVAGCAATWHSALPATPEAPRGFDSALVERGAALAAVGNCASCHTTSEGRPFAGGVPLATPFGTIYGTNITPDRPTGIGTWSQAAFVRAMRDGVARDGRLLYPAFPYDHFTHTTDGDLEALYAYLMTRDPVRQANAADALRFPFNLRPLIAGWNLLYLDRTPPRTDGAHDAEWNRGAYLVASLGHCASCHAPRNRLGAEQTEHGMAGGQAEGWYVPALNGASPSPLPWTVDALSAYLRTGIAAGHAMAGGPMQEVVGNLARAREEDVRAIATYVHSSLGPTTADRASRARSAEQRAALGPLARSQPNAQGADTQLLALGATVYQGACARCHDVGRTVDSSGALRLPLAIAVYDPDPRSLLRIVRDGITPPPGEPGRWMPAFGTMLSDEQLVGLLTYLRAAAADAPPWPDVASAVQATRASP